MLLSVEYRDHAPTVGRKLLYFAALRHRPVDIQVRTFTPHVLQRMQPFHLAR